MVRKNKRGREIKGGDQKKLLKKKGGKGDNEVRRKNKMLKEDN